MMNVVRAPPPSNDDGMASTSFSQPFFAVASQGLPSIVIEDADADTEADLHCSRSGVFSPPPRPIRPVIRTTAATAAATSTQRSVPHLTNDEEESADEYNDEDEGATATTYDAKRFSRSMSQDELVSPPMASSPPYRSRTGSAPSAGISHERSRSHFSIPDVMVTASEEDGNQVHFELQLGQKDRRIGLPSVGAVGLAGVHAFPSSSSLSSTASNTSSTTSDDELGSAAAMSSKKVRKHTPPAIRIVNAEGDPASSTAPLSRCDEGATETPVTASTTSSTSKLGQRLRKSSLPSLFSKRERDAARVAATSALPPSPTLPQHIIEEQLRRPSEPTPMRPRTGSLGDILTKKAAQSQQHGTAEGRPNTQRNASLPFQSTTAGPLSSPTLSYTSSAAPTSPTESSRSFSPLSAFFAGGKKDATVDDGRMSGSPMPASLSKKEMKQRVKEEKAMMKELEKVDRMVRKHDEKARKEAKKGGKVVAPSATLDTEAPLASPVMPPSAATTATTMTDEQEGRTKKAFRRMTLFRASTSATPRAAVPTRKPSVKHRDDGLSRASVQQQQQQQQQQSSSSPGTTPTAQPSHAPKPFAVVTQSNSQRPSPLRDTTNKVASPDREWTDVPSPVASAFTTKKEAATRAAPGPVAATTMPEASESASRRSSVRRALSARRRMSAAAGRAVRPRSSGQGQADNAPPLPRSSGKLGKDAHSTEAAEATTTPAAAPSPAFARPARPFLDAAQEAAKSRYRIESILVEGSHLGWEEELGLSWRDDTTPGGSGQVTPKALASKDEGDAPQLSLYNDNGTPGPSSPPTSPSSSSPPTLAMSMFESLYQEVDKMELSFGEKYPVEAEVRRKSLSIEPRRNSSSATGMAGIDLTDAPPSPSLPTDYQFNTAVEAATAKSSRKAKQSDGSAGSFREAVQRSQRERTTSASSSATSASSNAIPATPPLPAAFAAFKSATVSGEVAVPSDWSGGGGGGEGDVAAPPMLPSSSSQSKQSGTGANGRRIRVGANPRGFKFPPPPAHNATVKVEDGAA